MKRSTLCCLRLFAAALVASLGMIAVATADEAAAAAPRWMLAVNTNLSDNLKAWAEAAGWHLVWSAYVGNRKIDYPIDEEVVFVGPFNGVDGVVGRVVSTLNGLNPTYPLEVEFYAGNKVVEVRFRRNSFAAMPAQ